VAPMHVASAHSSPASSSAPEPAKAEIVGVVLAAGDGERMGGSKALLLVAGEPLAALHARRLREAGCRRVVVAVRPNVSHKVGSPEGARVVVSSAPDPAGSLAVAVRDGDIGSDAIVLVTPVDAAPVQQATLRTLIASLVGGVDAATPSHDGRSGHPVACRGHVLERYRREEAPPPLRDVIRALGDRRARIEVDDPFVLVDLDTPDDVVALTGERPKFAL
jgi:molybdenum cofactor cytidylyltransferase